MKTLKALGLIVAAILLLLGTRFETYHYQGSFWTLNRYTGQVVRCTPRTWSLSLNDFTGGCEEVGNVSFH
jgi:hypothetical protein